MLEGKPCPQQFEHGKGTAGSVPHRNGWTTTVGSSFRMAAAMRGWGWRGAKGKDTVAYGASASAHSSGALATAIPSGAKKGRNRLTSLTAESARGKKHVCHAGPGLLVGRRGKVFMTSVTFPLSQWVGVQANDTTNSKQKL